MSAVKRLCGGSLIAAALLSSSVSAADETPGFGVGIEGSLAPNPEVEIGETAVPLPSLSVLYRFSAPIRIQLLVGFGWADERIDTPVVTRSSVTTIHAGLRLHFVPLVYDQLNVGLVLGAGFRGRFGGADTAATTERLHRRGFGVELGVRPEWFAFEHLSLHTQLGVAFLLEDTNAGRRDLGVVMGANPLSQAGLTIWF